MPPYRLTEPRDRRFITVSIGRHGTPTFDMTVDAWLKAACEDAERRGLAELKPLLEGLARAMAALRDADRIIDRGRLEP